MSLLFNMMVRLVLTYLPRSKCLLISWLQSSFAVILEPKKRRSLTVSIVSPSICHEVMGPDGMILVYRILTFDFLVSREPPYCSAKWLYQSKFCQQCRSVPISLHPLQHLLCVVFWMMAILRDVSHYFIVVLTCISIITSDF